MTETINEYKLVIRTGQPQREKHIAFVGEVRVAPESGVVVRVHSPKVVGTGEDVILTSMQLEMAEHMVLTEYQRESTNVLWANILKLSDRLLRDSTYIGPKPDGVKLTPDEVRAGKLQRLSEAKELAATLLQFKSLVALGTPLPKGMTIADSQARVVADNLAGLSRELCDALRGRDPKVVKLGGSYYDELTEKASRFLKECSPPASGRTQIWRTNNPAARSND